MNKCEVVAGLGEKKSNGGTQFYQQDRVYDGDIAMAHPATLTGGSYNYLVNNRVRKLTEYECFYLMGVKPKDSKKIHEGQSMSASYHMAGDSIVTSVLMAIFGEIFDVEWKSKIKELQNEIMEEKDER